MSPYMCCQQKSKHWNKTMEENVTLERGKTSSTPDPCPRPQTSMGSLGTSRILIFPYFPKFGKYVEGSQLSLGIQSVQFWASVNYIYPYVPALGVGHAGIAASPSFPRGSALHITWPLPTPAHQCRMQRFSWSSFSFRSLYVAIGPMFGRESMGTLQGTKKQKCNATARNVNISARSHLITLQISPPQV